MAGITEEAGKAVTGVVTSIGTQPLALALVVMNLVLLGFLFYVQHSTNSQRKETVDLIVGWQKDTDKLMANCVSGEVTRTMLDNMQHITETMLAAEQKEVTRMQKAIDDERSRNWEMLQREQKVQDELRKRELLEPKAQKLSFEPSPPGWAPLRLPPVKPDVPWLPLN
jgi:hypothetical protein